MRRGAIRYLSLCLALAVCFYSVPLGIPISTAQAFAPQISGQWEMTANRDYQFLLDITQIGNRITGRLTRTNGNEPVDRISGIVHGNGVIEFTRQRQGAWRQHYRGTMTQRHGFMVLEGTFNHDGSGSYAWSARRNPAGGPPAQDTPSHVGGRWKMIANHDYAFILSIEQHGRSITGTMVRTNGHEPVDRISGVYNPDGTISFTRYRRGEWEQHYQGRVYKQHHRDWVMEGTFDNKYTWSAQLP